RTARRRVFEAQDPHVHAASALKMLQIYPHDFTKTLFFVVRNDKSQSDIIYQTSDTTVAAYNPYGGNSLYQCRVNCPAGDPLVYKGAYKVSFNRPNVATSLGMQHSFFGAEFEMVEFLEANGYDVSYISGVDSDRNGDLLKHHHVFISCGHDEYWSAKQR